MRFFKRKIVSIAPVIARGVCALRQSRKLLLDCFAVLAMTILFISPASSWAAEEGAPEQKPDATKTSGPQTNKPDSNKDLLGSLFDGGKEEQTKAGNATSKENKDAEALFASSTYQDFAEQPEEKLFDESYLAGNPDATSQLAMTEEEKPVIDPGVTTKTQAVFLNNLYPAFNKIADYATKLLYLFAILELAMFGMMWALQRDIAWEKAIFKIIKIGLIFFIIQNYPYLVETIMHSFIKLAGVMVNKAEAAQYVFNPAKIWQYGYDFGVDLLHSATTAGNNFGLAMVYILLGAGILVTFGLLSMQMAVQMLGFYLVALGALIFLPFGAFSLGRNMFDKAVQAVFQAGIRLMSVITVIGIAAIIWDNFGLIDPENHKNPNINQCLGLLFSALLFAYLAFYLPKILSQLVGSLRQDFDPAPAAAGGAAVGFGAVNVDVGGSGDMQAATVIDAAPALGSGGQAAGFAGTAAPVAVSVSSPSGMEAKLTKEAMDQAHQLNKSISEHTVRKIKEAVAQANKTKE